MPPPSERRSEPGRALDCLLLEDRTVPTATVAVEALTNVDESGSAGTFRFTRSGDLSAALTVALDFAGTATWGIDYTSPVSITFGANADVGEVAIAPNADNWVEADDETVTLTLGEGSSAYVGVGDSATLALIDDAPVILLDPVTDAVAGGESGAFRLTRSGGDLAQALTATYAIGGTATATAGDEYTALMGAAIFAANATTVDVIVSAAPPELGQTNSTVELTLTGDETTYYADAGVATLTISITALYPQTVATGDGWWYPAMVTGSPDEIWLHTAVTRVSADEYRWEQTFTNTSLDNGPGSFFQAGVHRLDLSILDLDDILRFETPLGWTAAKDSFAANLEGPGFVRWETNTDDIMPQESRTFVFYTEPRSITWGGGIGYSPGSPEGGAVSAEGPGMAPEPPMIESTRGPVTGFPLRAARFPRIPTPDWASGSSPKRKNRVASPGTW